MRVGQPRLLRPRFTVGYLPRAAAMSLGTIAIPCRLVEAAAQGGDIVLELDLTERCEIPTTTSVRFAALAKGNEAERQSGWGFTVRRCEPMVYSLIVRN
jgi:hypothetical protein